MPLHFDLVDLRLMVHVAERCSVMHGVHGAPVVACGEHAHQEEHRRRHRHPAARPLAPWRHLDETLAFDRVGLHEASALPAFAREWVSVLEEDARRALA